MRISCEESWLSLVAAITMLLVCNAVVADGATGPVQDANVQIPHVPDDPNHPRWGQADRFRIVCNSIELSSKAAIPGGEEGAKPSVPERTLTISAKLDILDTNDLVGMDVIDLGIVSVRDGNDTGVRFLSSRYQFLRQYQQVRHAYVGDPVRDTLLPSGFTLVIRLDPNQPVPSSLSRVEGYIYALYAEDKIQVDVPFGPPRDWVDAAPGLRIIVTADTPPPPGPLQLTPRGSSSSSSYAAPIAIYEFWTCVQSTTGRPVLGLEDRWPSGVSWSLGDYVVVETSLYDHVKDRSMFVSTPSVWSDPWGRDGAICSGWARQDLNAYDMIRHTIAVHPVEVKIPFVLTNIPIPGLQGAGK